MSDKSEKPASAPGLTAGEMQPGGSPTQSDPVPENIVTPVDGEIDLARLAPQLRGLYQELLNEPIPDRFSKLLDELTRKETDSK